MIQLKDHDNLMYKNKYQNEITGSHDLTLVKQNTDYPNQILLLSNMLCFFFFSCRLFIIFFFAKDGLKLLLWRGSVVNNPWWL